MQELNYQRLLSIPLENHEIQWRAGQTGVKHNGEPWVKVLAYMDSRAVQRRFDLVFGIENWQVEMLPLRFANITVDPSRMSYENIKMIDQIAEKTVGFSCKISCRIDGEWISKMGSAQASHVEGIKGAESDALKRCAFIWGIGRYLYDLGDTFAPAVCTDRRPDKSQRWSYASVKNPNGGFIKFHWQWPVMPDSMLPKPEEVKILRDLEDANLVWGPTRDISLEPKVEE